MKIMYLSQAYFADCDFPLIRELQNQGHDVEYYIPIASYNLKSTLLDLKELYPQTGIYPASIYEGFRVYDKELDLNKVFVVNQKYKQKYHPLNILLMLRLVIRFIIRKPDVIHLTLPPSLMLKALYLVKKKIVLTVHDPFVHSGRISKREEKDRAYAFKNIDKFILLNKKQIKPFSEFYDIPLKKIFLSKLGMYDSIIRITPSPVNINKPYILFFGLISEYKGVEYLLQAMKTTHEQFPDIKLIVAGGGKYYFDISPYKTLDYIEIWNRYIGITELAGLLRNCLFAVCPYKDATQSGVIQTAFSLEVPMVVTNVGALSEAVNDGITGMVVPPCNSIKLAEAMNMLLGNPKLLATYRHNISTIWKKEMSWKSIAKDYKACYEAEL